MCYKVPVFWILWGSSCLASIWVAGLECGYPGSPAYGRPHPVKETYRPGEAVLFTCAHGYALQGPMQRVCNVNGTWAGLLPLCDRSLSSVEHLASSRQTLSLYPANKSIDGDPRTCTYTDKSRPRWIRVDMRENHRVKAVAITVPASMYSQTPAHLTIYAISIRDSTIASYHKCASFNGRFSAATLKLSCSLGEVEGRYIHIEDNRDRVDYFSLCEIQIFVNKGSYECGEAERPAHAYSERTETGAVDYKCIYGYRLMGIPTRYCLPDGQWSHSQPICQEIVCPNFHEIEHGRIHYERLRQKDYITLGTVVNVSCDYGYRMSGSPSQCEENGEWSGGTLSCEPIDCGMPIPQYNSERYILVNGTTYGSVVLLQCGSRETVLTCREDGSWSPSDLDCAEQSVLSKLGLVEEQNDVPIGIVIGMAVVVLILLLLVIVVLLMKRYHSVHEMADLFLRRKVFRRNSTDSLPSKETGSTLATNSPQPYENDAFYATIPVDNHDSTETKKNFLSTILFTRKKDSTESNSTTTSTDKKDSIDSTSTLGCIYEEVGAKLKSKKNKLTVPQNGQTGSQNDDDYQPVYAQVNFDEKRRSRLIKSLTERFEPVDPPPWESTYRAEEAPTFDDIDLEPIKLRELPPIPDDSGSDITYASLCIPLEPPSLVRQNELYQEPCHDSVTGVMKDNELYS